MYGIVLMMTLSGGTDLPAADMFEPAPKMTQTAYRYRRNGCGGGCYGGCYGGCHGGCHGSSHGVVVSGCYGGGHVGYAYGVSPGYSGYAFWEMPTSSYYTYYPGWGWAPAYSSYSTYYPAPLNGTNGNQAPAPSAQPPAEQERRAPAPGERPNENRPPENLGALPNMAPISLTVRLPAEARLSVDDAATRTSGETRLFISPPVQTGKEYHYTLHAELQRNGRMERADKDITVRPGQENMITLDQSAFKPESK